jgi:intracellular sulfur oxidation DsrE/DsrF family protein
MSDLIASTTPRRGFLARIAAATAAAGLTGLVPARLHAEAPTAELAADPALQAWFGKIKGKHRQVFDVPEPNSGMGAIWPRVYINTMDATYPGGGTTAVVILRHGGLGMAMQDALWAKYKFGEVFGVKDGEVPATRNIYAKIEGLPIAGLGIAELIKSGVLVGACDVAMTVYSSGVAKKMGLDPAEVKKEWVAGLIPGVQLVPSGVMAVARAQELGCAYCFAG